MLLNTEIENYIQTDIYQKYVKDDDDGRWLRLAQEHVVDEKYVHF